MEQQQIIVVLYVLLDLAGGMRHVSEFKFPCFLIKFYVKMLPVPVELMHVHKICMAKLNVAPQIGIHILPHTFVYLTVIILCGNGTLFCGAGCRSGPCINTTATTTSAIASTTTVSGATTSHATTTTISSTTGMQLKAFGMDQLIRFRAC